MLDDAKDRDIVMNNIHLVFYIMDEIGEEVKKDGKNPGEVIKEFLSGGIIEIIDNGAFYEELS